MNSGWNWNLDELVDKVMADLRNNDVNLSKSNISDALTRDFRSIQSRKIKDCKLQDRSTSDCVNKEVVKREVQPDEFFLLKERVVFEEVVCKLASQTSSKFWRVRSDVVVTPLAKDALKKRNIELIFEEETASNNLKEVVASSRIVRKSRVTFSASNVEGSLFLPRENNGSQINQTRVFWANHLRETERIPSSVCEYLSNNSSLTESYFSCLKEASRKIQNEINNDKSLKVVLVTHDSSVASIWCNRLSGIRAVVAFSFDQVCCDLEAANANVIIVDPLRIGSYQFRRIVDCYLRSETK